MSTKHESIKTPLARARGLGSAHEGAHHWWVQRVTSVALLLLSLVLLWFLPQLVAADRAAAIAVLKHPVVMVAMLIYVPVAFYHAYLGVQVIIEDYVHCKALKTASLLAKQFAFAALGVFCLYALLTINFTL